MSGCLALGRGYPGEVVLRGGRPDRGPAIVVAAATYGLHIERAPVISVVVFQRDGSAVSACVFAGLEARKDSTPDGQLDGAVRTALPELLGVERLLPLNVVLCACGDAAHSRFALAIFFDTPTGKAIPELVFLVFAFAQVPVVFLENLSAALGAVPASMSVWIGAFLFRPTAHAAGLQLVGRRHLGGLAFGRRCTEHIGLQLVPQPQVVFRRDWLVVGPHRYRGPGNAQGISQRLLGAVGSDRVFLLDGHGALSRC
jgi:hypothetical protein